MPTSARVDRLKMFKDNWQRFYALDNSADLRTRFEALYNCFENAGQIITNQANRQMVDALKVDTVGNVIRLSFLSRYNQPNKGSGSLLFHIKKLRALAPIYNTTNGLRVYLTKDAPLETFLDALYLVRNNVRHGMKDFSDRSDAILAECNSILHMLISDAYGEFFKDEIRARLEHENMLRKMQSDADAASERMKEMFSNLLRIAGVILFFSWPLLSVSFLSSNNNKLSSVSSGWVSSSGNGKDQRSSAGFGAFKRANTTEISVGNTPPSLNEHVFTNYGDSYKNATYTLADQQFTLQNCATTTKEIDSGSSGYYFTNDVMYLDDKLIADINGDGRKDVAFIATLTTGGTGRFYYAVVALNTPKGYLGSDSYLLGDRITPGKISLSEDAKGKAVVIFNYVDRKLDEPMIAESSINQSVSLKLNAATMQWERL